MLWVISYVVAVVYLFLLIVERSRKGLKSIAVALAIMFICIVCSGVLQTKAKYIVTTQTKQKLDQFQDTEKEKYVLKDLKNKNYTYISKSKIQKVNLSDTNLKEENVCKKPTITKYETTEKTKIPEELYVFLTGNQIETKTTYEIVVPKGGTVIK